MRICEYLLWLSNQYYFSDPSVMCPPEMVVEEYNIIFERADKGLGLSIAGGLGSTPYKPHDEGIFISRVTPGGPAEQAGLHKDDKVLTVNGHSCDGIDHYEAVGILKAAGSLITMRISREVPRRRPMKTHPQPQQLCDSVSVTSSLSHAGSNHSNITATAASNYRTPSSLQLSNTQLFDSSIVYEKAEKLYTTLLRDERGLGFSIAGGKGAEEQYVKGSDSVYISRIAEDGPAATDGKLQVGDRLLQINGVDVTDAEHTQVVAMLTGLERFVRLVVERGSGESPISPASSVFTNEKSPKVFGVPKPYTGLYSASSYMANRPSYMRTREPGQYTLNSTSSNQSSSNLLPGSSSYGKLPGVSGMFSSIAPGDKKNLISGSKTLPEIPRSRLSETGKEIATTNPQQVAHNPERNVQDLVSELPPAPTKPGTSTEILSRTTYTETTVKRVTNNPPPAKKKIAVEDVLLIKAGGPLGLSIIGGSDHSCIPFGTGEPGIFISKIIPGGAAAKTNKLRMGDRILNVNGKDIRGASHQDAVMALLQSPDQINLSIQHDPLPEGFMVRLLFQLLNIFKYF